MWTPYQCVIHYSTDPPTSSLVFHHSVTTQTPSFSIGQFLHCPTPGVQTLQQLQQRSSRRCWKTVPNVKTVYRPTDIHARRLTRHRHTHKQNDTDRYRYTLVNKHTGRHGQRERPTHTPANLSVYACMSKAQPDMGRQRFRHRQAYLCANRKRSNGGSRISCVRRKILSEGRHALFAL